MSEVKNNMSEVKNKMSEADLSEGAIGVVRHADLAEEELQYSRRRE